MMDRSEFEMAWSAMRAKLTDAEREMLDVVVAGADVNHVARLTGNGLRSRSVVLT